MAKRSGIPVRTTRIRRYFRRFAEYAVEEIDQFREHVDQGRVSEQRAIAKLAEDLPEEQKDYLADDLYQLDKISDLTDQLSIIALYRVVELMTGRMLAHEFGSAARRKASDVRQLRHYLRQHKSFDLETLPHYRAINELRLLNNAIKHSGRVTDKLANEFPRWKNGDKLSGLDAAYDRLSPKVPKYIFRLAERMKLRFR